MYKRFYHYFLLMRLHKPVGILLLLWPTLWAIWIASQGHPQLSILIIFTLGVVLMRSAGVVINDIADRNFDCHVQRTRARPITNGQLSVWDAGLLLAFLLSAAFILACFLNRFAMQLAFVGLFLAAIYPFMKRYTYWPQFFLGLAYSWCIPMVFAEQLNTIPAIAWLLFLINIIWTLAYDTQYAMVDRPDDLKIGVKSTAILFGSKEVLIIISLEIMVLFLFLLLGRIMHMDGWFYFSIFVASLFVIYQYFLIRKRHGPDCLKAFLNNQWVGAVIFIGILLQ